MPVPNPLYGRIYCTADKRIGFRKIAIPLFMFSIVNEFGKLPGLTISILSENIKILTVEEIIR
jgi:hypothetical protein